jgi:hypothetical protein
MMSGLKSQSLWYTTLIIMALVCVLMVVGCTSTSSVPAIPSRNASFSPTLTILPVEENLSSSQTPIYGPQEINSSFTIFQGDTISFPGAAPSENISVMRVWIFNNKSAAVSTVPVQQHSAFLFNLTTEQTSVMPNGKYRILFEFPSSDNRFSMRIASVGKRNDTVLYNRWGNKVLDVRDITDNHLNGLAAAAAVEQAIRETGNENVTGLTLIVNEPEIEIDPIPDHTVGDTVTIRGTTNLPAGAMATVQIYIGSYKCSRCQWVIDDSVKPCCGLGFAREVTVMPGKDGSNVWSLDVNTSCHDFLGGMSYTVGCVGEGNVLAQNSSVFNLLPVAPTPDQFHYVTINSPVASPNENTVLLSGSSSTDFGPRDKFLLQIASDSGATVTAVVPSAIDGLGYGWNYTVNISALSPHTSYEVNITSMNDARIRNSRVFMV